MFVTVFVFVGIVFLLRLVLFFGWVFFVFSVYWFSGVFGIGFCCGTSVKVIPRVQVSVFFGIDVLLF